MGKSISRSERRFVRAKTAIALFRNAPPVDAAQLLRDIDELVDQSIEPRG